MPLLQILVTRHDAAKVKIDRLQTLQVKEGSGAIDLPVKH